MIRIKFKGIDDLNKASIMLEDKARKGAQGAVDAAADSLVEDIKSSWSPVAPSSPGASPAVVTGELNDSIIAGQGRNARGQFTSGDSVIKLVRAGAPHAPLLEGGTYKMSPRPFMRPAVTRLRSTYPEIAKDYIVL